MSKIEPQWDLETLVTLGYSELTCLTNNERCMTKSVSALSSTPMFMIAASGLDKSDLLIAIKIKSYLHD